MQFEKDLGKIRDVLASKLTGRDALVVANVAIHVDPNLVMSHNAAAGITSSGRVVFVALSLAYELGLVAEAEYAEHAFGISGLTRRFAQHFIESYTYRGRKLLPLEDFAFLNASAKSQLLSTKATQAIQAWWQSGLAFVLAHELGHHVANALYLPSDSDLEKRRKETLADEWAAEAMLRVGLSPAHGMMLVTFLLDSEERILPGSYQGDHPFIVDRALHLLDKYESKQHELYKSPPYASTPLGTFLDFEVAWKKELESLRQLIADRSITNLERKSKDGDTEASEILAIDYLNGLGVTKSVTQASIYLERAAESGDFWAQYTLGVIYSDGTAGSPDYARARFWLSLSDRAGAGGAPSALTVVETQISNETSKIAWCQGKCMFDLVQLELAPCEMRMRARCVDSCENRYKHSKLECETRFCNNISDDQRNFGSCFRAPSAASWQACHATCDPAVSTPAKNSPIDDFSSAIQQVIGSTDHGFGTIRGRLEPREADDTSSFYRATVTLPGMDDCQVIVDDDPKISPSYSCDQYRGSDHTIATSAYKLVVGRLNVALAKMVASQNSCKETTEQSGTKVKQDITECASTITNGVTIRVRRALSTFTTTKHSTEDVTLWVDLPRR